jgi:hypothetical protein
MELLNTLRSVLGITEKDVTITDTTKALVAERTRLKNENQRLTVKLSTLRGDVARLGERLDWVPTKKTTKKHIAEYRAATSKLVCDIISRTYPDGGYFVPNDFAFETRRPISDAWFDVKSCLADEFSKRLARNANFSLMYGSGRSRLAEYEAEMRGVAKASAKKRRSK